MVAAPPAAAPAASPPAVSTLAASPLAMPPELVEESAAPLASHPPAPAPAPPPGPSQAAPQAPPPASPQTPTQAPLQTPPLAPDFADASPQAGPAAPDTPEQHDTPDRGEPRVSVPERGEAVDPLETNELEALKARIAARNAALVEASPGATARSTQAPGLARTPELAQSARVAEPVAAPSADPEGEPAVPSRATSTVEARPDAAEPLATPTPTPTLEPEPLPAPAPPAPEPVSRVVPEPIAEIEATPEPGLEPSPEPSPAPSPAQASGAVAPAPPQVRVVEPELPPGMLMSFRPRERVAEERAFDPNAPRNRSAGHVISCSGNAAIVRADTGCYDTVTGDQWAVGRMLSIQAGGNRVVALVHHIETPLAEYDPEADSATLLVHVELQGEVQDREDGSSKFQKGITSYPPIGAVCHQIRAADLGAIYAATGGSTAEIGTLSQDATVPAFVEIEDMIAKHFAVLGSTGCGKSSSVSLLLHASQEIMPDLRVLILDPHNEYSCAFPDSTTITADNLDLPFWLFQLEEYVECLFRGKPVVQEEVDALREFLPQAKVRFRDGDERKSSLRAQDNSNNAITADTPIPYRISDLLSCLEEELGLLDSKMDKSVLKSLKNRIDTHANDPRFAFMFRHRTITDVAGQVLGRLFAMAPDTKGLTTILQMAGMPAEVVNAVASVLCRMAFELSIAARGGMKVLVVCEEAHRYVPVDASAAFGPTRRAIARIAKEGRKYGCFMAIVSQRPAELDPTILSQCCTVFSLRLGNDADQDIIRKSISTGSASAVTFLSSIGNREAIAFGEGFSTPMRMKFANLPSRWLPGQDSDVFGHMGGDRQALELAPTLRAWRGGGH